MEYVLSIIALPQVGLKRITDPFKDFLVHVKDHFIPHARNNYHPHILGHRSLALLSGLLVVVKIFTLTVLSLGPVAPAFSSAITTDNIISLTNESRAQFGLKALSENSLLDKAAQTKADDMLARGYFSHNTPDGKTPWTFILNAGYSYLMAGENLAVNFTESESVETAWMNSPGHKANILNKNFEEIGIGIAQGQYQEHTAIFVVQMFGNPAEQSVALSEKPTQVQTSPVPEPTTLNNQVQGASSETKSLAVGSLKVATQNVNAKAQDKTVTVLPESVTVNQGDVKLTGDVINISAQVSGPVARVVAYFGQEAIMLAPKSNTLWEGQVSLSSLAEKNASVRIRAFGMQEQTDQLQLADFSAGTLANYNLAGTTPVNQVNFLNMNINPKSMESHFYLFLISVLLASMILAIAVKRHIQHLPLIANSSFVIIFATLIWWAG